MADQQNRPVPQQDFEDLKGRMAMIAEADPSQHHDDFSTQRFLRAFKTADASFQAMLKCNKWRRDYGVECISPTEECIQKELIAQKALLLMHRDIIGRPVIYIAARKHDVNERDIDEFTRFIVYTLERACKRCHDEIIDNLCIVFDLKDFKLSCMDYQFVKNLIWLLSKYYPERLGVCLIINAPTLFSGCWTIIKQMLSEATAEKVKFVADEQDLCKYLIPDILPEDT
ncbi:uncharacterized protein LOC135493518 [Lineus longissimus]|uniref:uncharacterized protein LOC135493518 n=1 Tax=Lineus longissimus TaxID=88925 RepID=UPI002B4E6CBE